MTKNRTGVHCIFRLCMCLCMCIWVWVYACVWVRESQWACAERESVTPSFLAFTPSPSPPPRDHLHRYRRRSLLLGGPSTPTVRSYGLVERGTDGCKGRTRKTHRTVLSAVDVYRVWYTRVRPRHYRLGTYFNIVSSLSFTRDTFYRILITISHFPPVTILPIMRFIYYYEMLTKQQNRIVSSETLNI